MGSSLSVLRGGGRPMSSKAGNFLFRLLQLKIWCRWGSIAHIWNWADLKKLLSTSQPSIHSLTAVQEQMLGCLQLPPIGFHQYIPSLISFQQWNHISQYCLWWNILSLWLLVCLKCRQYIQCQNVAREKYFFKNGKSHISRTHLKMTTTALDVTWRRPKISSSTVLSEWIESWTVLRGFLRSI